MEPFKDRRYRLLSESTDTLQPSSTTSDVDEKLLLRPSSAGTRLIAILKRPINSFLLASLRLGGCIVLWATVKLALWDIPTPACPLNSQLVYSPAKSALRFLNTTFGNGFDERSIYQGPPTPAVDHAWMRSYSFLNRIDHASAQRLEFDTAPIDKGAAGRPDDTGYVVTLEVFHSLHCLDELRKTVWPAYYGSLEERYGVSREMAEEHQDHCVEALREAIMCGSDITPHSWRYSSPASYHLESVGPATHSCRDFDAIKRWALDHDMGVPWMPVGLEGQFEGQADENGKFQEGKFIGTFEGMGDQEHHHHH